LPPPELKFLPPLLPEPDRWLTPVSWLVPALPPELALWVPLPALELCVDPPLGLWLPPELKLWPLPELKL
jgi:hypothetical protein